MKFNPELAWKKAVEIFYIVWDDGAINYL